MTGAPRGDYAEQDVTDLDRLEIATLMLLELDDPGTVSVQLERQGRRLVLRSFFVALDLAALDPPPPADR